MQSSSELTQLANLITSSLETLQEEWKKAGIPEPSLDPSGPEPSDFTNIKIEKAYRTLLGSTKALNVRIAGPLRSAVSQFQQVRL